MERWHRAIGAAAPQRAVGVNITWQTETYYRQPSAPYRRATQPSYAVVGLMARYEMDKHMVDVGPCEQPVRQDLYAGSGLLRHGCLRRSAQCAGDSALPLLRGGRVRFDDAERRLAVEHRRCQWLHLPVTVSDRYGRTHMVNL